MRRPTLFALLGVLCACEQAADARFATPEATARTLLASYGLDAVPEAEVRARLAAHATFTLRDPETFHACFADLASPADEGLGGYVVGALAAAKDSSTLERSGDRAAFRVRGGAEAPAIVLRERDGVWKIVLAESVPREVRAQLRAVHRRAARRRLGS